MSRTLNDLISAAVFGGEEVEDQAPQAVAVHTESAVDSNVDLGDVEKLASALEFIGRRGVANLIGEKTAMAKCPGCGGKIVKGYCSKCKTMVKKASHPENNMGQMHSEHVQKQVGPHAGAPPMKPPGFGQIPNNAGQKPGGGKAVDTAGQGHGTHHSALASNEAAINYNKKEKSKKVSPALSAVLDTTAFSDPKLKENLSNTAGDKNIHKRAHDSAAIRAELERRGRNI